MERKSLNKLVMEQSNELFADRAKASFKHHLYMRENASPMDGGNDEIPFTGRNLMEASPGLPNEV